MFAGKPIPAITGQADLDQMPDTPTRRSQHRRAHSETFFRLPDPDAADLDDIIIDDVNLDLPPTPPSIFPTANNNGNRSEFHFRSLSMDADFFEGFGLDAPSHPPPPRHRHSNSMDGYTSPTSSEVDSSAKKAMASDRLAELALIDPKRAKRILANRQSAARSKERKIRYTSELERKVQTLQAEATTLSAQITVLQRDTTGLTSENKELKLKLQALEQEAHLRDALNDALRNELQRLKITSGQIPSANGTNTTATPSSRPPLSLHYFSNQPFHTHPLDGGSSSPSFEDLGKQI